MCDFRTGNDDVKCVTRFLVVASGVLQLVCLRSCCLFDERGAHCFSTASSVNSMSNLYNAHPLHVLDIDIHRRGSRTHMHSICRPGPLRRGIRVWESRARPATRSHLIQLDPRQIWPVEVSTRVMTWFLFLF